MAVGNSGEFGQIIVREIVVFNHHEDYFVQYTTIHPQISVNVWEVNPEELPTSRKDDQNICLIFSPFGAICYLQYIPMDVGHHRFVNCQI